MRYFPAIFIIFIFSTYAKQKNDSLFNYINTKEIREMTDGEYRFFKEYIDDNDIEYDCDNPTLNSIKNKSVIDMNNNEYEFFEDFIFNCDTIIPCSLLQYIEIKNKNEYDMTNNEIEWYKDVKDECENYMEKHPITKRKKILRRTKQIFLYVLLPVLFVGIAMLAYSFKLE